VYRPHGDQEGVAVTGLLLLLLYYFLADYCGLLIGMARTKNVSRQKEDREDLRERSPARSPSAASARRSQYEEEVGTSAPTTATGTTTATGATAARPQDTTARATSDKRSKRRDSSSSSQRSGSLYKTCESCRKGNQLAVGDAHSKCFACLGFGHLYMMKVCLQGTP
jgi:hypothetical protein